MYPKWAKNTTSLFSKCYVIASRLFPSNLKIRCFVFFWKMFAFSWKCTHFIAFSRKQGKCVKIKVSYLGSRVSKVFLFRKTNYLSIAFACGNLTFNIRMEFFPKGVSDWGSEHDATSLHHKPVGHNRCITTQWVPRFRQWPCHFNQFFEQTRVTDVPSEISETVLTALPCL